MDPWHKELVFNWLLPAGLCFSFFQPGKIVKGISYQNSVEISLLLLSFLVLSLCEFALLCSFREASGGDRDKHMYSIYYI